MTVFLKNHKLKGVVWPVRFCTVFLGHNIPEKWAMVKNWTFFEGPKMAVFDVFDKIPMFFCQNALFWGKITPEKWAMFDVLTLLTFVKIMNFTKILWVHPLPGPNLWKKWTKTRLQSKKCVIYGPKTVILGPIFEAIWTDPLKFR